MLYFQMAARGRAAMRSSEGDQNSSFECGGTRPNNMLRLKRTEQVLRALFLQIGSPTKFLRTNSLWKAQVDRLPKVSGDTGVSTIVNDVNCATIADGQCDFGLSFDR